MTYRDTESDIESDAGLKRAVTEDRVWTWVETVSGVVTQEVTVRFGMGRHWCRFNSLVSKFTATSEEGRCSSPWQLVKIKARWTEISSDAWYAANRSRDEMALTVVHAASIHIPHRSECLERPGY